jgi:hypothetical protein
LTVPNVVPVAAQGYDLLLIEGGQNLVGRLSLLTDSDGTLVDSWIGITRLRNGGISGTYRCSGGPDAPSCTLSATTAVGVVSMSPSETIALASHGNSTLTGTIGVRGSAVNLPLTATPSTE